MNEQIKRNLIDLAKEAMKNAYVPVSNFQVGAAILTDSGAIYTGCNIENASYGATNCAERTAIFKAVSEGERKIEAVAITSSANDITYPCGICRQAMCEFMDDNGIILLEDKDGKIHEFTLGQLIPGGFRLDDIK